MESQNWISNESLLNLGNQNDYLEDHKIVIKQREMERIPYLHQSPQIMYRKYLIDYLKGYRTRKQLSYSCLHLAVYILDIFMDNHSIAVNRLHLVANVCLLIAIKFEEVNLKIPKFEELNAVAQSSYTSQDYKLVEIIILKFFHWYLFLPTAAHYVHYFMQSILIQSDLVNENRSSRTLMCEIREKLKILLDQVIDDVHYMQHYKPSRLAAAIISAARTQVGLCGWIQQLEQLTDFSKEQLHEPVQILLKAKSITCPSCYDLIKEKV